MGCASAVNNKQVEDDGRRIIRLDLQSIKSTSTPKNEINLMKLTEQLLKVLEVACGEDKAKFDKFQDLILNNTNKLDRRLDEVTYLLNMAKEQVLVFQDNAQIINLCFDLAQHLSKMLELNQKTFSDKSDWYYRYSYVLIYEISELSLPLSYMVESSSLKTQYQKSKEILILYACILGVIRFLEGISWGYSVFLMHQQLDSDNIIAIKVMFNLMLRLKQHFRESKDFSNVFTNDKNANYYSEHFFQNVFSYSALEKLITQSDYKKEEQKPKNMLFLQNQVFRKTYINAKKQIDDWLRHVKQIDISVNDLKKYKQIKSFTRSFLRELKNPIAKTSTGETQKQEELGVGGISQVQNQSQLTNRPTFEIENSNNILLLVGNDQDSKAIVESFLQANIKTRTKYKCCVLHHCVRENKISQDPYYIVKNIIYQILRTIPSLKNYMKLQEHNFVEEMLSSFDPEKLDLQRDNPDILVKFCKILKELKLDFNVGVFITGIENLYSINRLENFIYILRSASLYFPNFLKIVLTIEKRESKSEKCQKIIKLLQTQTIVEINDQEIFEKEGKGYLDFALTFSQQKASSQAEEHLDKEEVAKNLELCMEKCKGSYRRGIEMIGAMNLNNINVRDTQLVKDFIINYYFQDEIYDQILTKAIQIDKKLAQTCFQMLSSLCGPAHLDAFKRQLLFESADQQSEQNLLDILKQAGEVLHLQNSQIFKANQGASPEDYLGNPKTIIVAKNRSLLKNALLNNGVDASTKNVHESIYSYYTKKFETIREGQDHEYEFEELDTYLRLYAFHHIGKASCSKVFESLQNMFSVKNIYKQILYHRSYLRYRWKIMDLIESEFVDKEDQIQIIQFQNIIHLIEQTIKGEPLNFLDFCTQLRGRIIGDGLGDFFTDLRLEITNENICYFKNFHHALRENPRIDIIMKMPKCTVLRIKFFSDKKRLVMSLSNGTLLFYNTNENCIQKVFVNKMAIMDLMKIIDDKYLIIAGIDSKVRIWNIDSEKIISKFQIHPHMTILMSCHKEFIYSYGYDMNMAKFNFKNKTLDITISALEKAGGGLTAMKILKTVDESNKFKVVTSSMSGQITLFDMNLVPLRNINGKIAINEEVIQLINLSNTEFLSFTKEGSINVFSNSTLEESKTGSIFNLKSEDYIELILIKSREFFLFTLEKQKIEFYSASTFKRTDSWDYFFERDLICCDKNKEGSKIFVSDKIGYTVLFNFLKHLDQSKENLVPCNRRYDPVVCIEVTEKLEPNSIISCSQDRDLRIWRRDNGVFVKKYDLSSFTGENITAMKLGKDENMLFLGSKDMNVYLIDISKGKLCVVYEGHWNRVTAIYTIPNKDILITISESNIKVWDLEYDECIKNMNEHNSSIVYISQSQTDPEQVMTIGQSFEFKTWNYVTGSISNSHDIELNKDKKQLKNLNVICCDVMSDMAYIALNTNEISVYSVKDNKVLYSFLSYNDEQIIFLNGIKTDNANYLVVVTRTSCILYLVLVNQVKRLCSYLVNARKKPQKKKYDNKYSYNVRYYFTSAKITLVNQVHSNQAASVKTKKVNSQDMPTGSASTQQKRRLQAHGNSSMNNEISTNLNVEGSVLTKDVIRQDIQDEDDEGAGLLNNQHENDIIVDGEGMSAPTKIIDTIGSKIRDTVALVCLGDSRGFVHMNHLILK